MNILDLTLPNSEGKPVRIPAFSARWWLFAVAGGLGGAAVLWTLIFALSLVF